MGKLKLKFHRIRALSGVRLLEPWKHRVKLLWKNAWRTFGFIQFRGENPLELGMWDFILHLILKGLFVDFIFEILVGSVQRRTQVLMMRAASVFPSAFFDSMLDSFQRSLFYPHYLGCHKRCGRIDLFLLCFDFRDKCRYSLLCIHFNENWHFDSHRNCIASQQLSCRCHTKYLWWIVRLLLAIQSWRSVFNATGRWIHRNAHKMKPNKGFLFIPIQFIPMVLVVEWNGMENVPQSLIVRSPSEFGFDWWVVTLIVTRLYDKPT